MQTSQPDIVPLVKHLCLSLQSYARSRQVQIFFTTNKPYIAFNNQPSDIIHCLSTLLCRIISFLPARSKLKVNTSIIDSYKVNVVQLSIHNNGIDLCNIREITNGLKLPVTVQSPGDKETNFFIQIQIPDRDEEVVTNQAVKINDNNFPPFFEEVRKRLQRYFSRTNNYLENLNDISPRKAAFLKKINDCILQNLDNENFDATALSKGMAMSRAQLFRKLKPIISQPPAAYIKGIRLQQAKQLLEVSDLSVSEVAYKTGFKTPSHFTKVFTEKFGIRPSVLSSSKAHVTNE